MTTVDPGETRHSALASQMRRRVLQMLIEAPAPLDARTISASTGLHVSTARFHLDQLTHAGLVRRDSERTGSRGRPRVLYSADPSARATEAQRTLTEALAEALSHDEDGGRARALDAGHSWARTLPLDPDDAGDDITAFTTSLERLGFDPDEPRSGDIDLRACPLRSMAADHTDIVCTVHLGLVQGTAERLGHRAEDVELTPFVAPGLCRVHMRDAFAAGA